MTEKRVKMRVFGMTCDDCALTVTRGFREREGVLDVSVSLPDGRADVKIDDDRIKPEELETLPVFSGGSPYRAQLREIND